MSGDASQVYVTISGQDRLGLISAVTACLFDLGATLGDTSYTVLGTGFDFSAVCDMPAGVTLAEIRTGLVRLEVLEGARITVEPFELEPSQAENARITHRLRVTGGDRPGLIARLSEVFQQFEANVVRMTSVRRLVENEQYDYITRFAVHIPEGRSDACMAAIDNTAQQLSLMPSWE